MILLCCADELFDRPGLALEFCFDRSIGEVSDVTPDAEGIGARANEAPEVDSLDPAIEPDPYPDRHHVPVPVRR